MFIMETDKYMTMTLGLTVIYEYTLYYGVYHYPCKRVISF